MGNRDTPLFGLNGTLKWVENLLVLLEERREFTYLVGNVSQKKQLKLVVAYILENGNFILKDVSNRTC